MFKNLTIPCYEKESAQKKKRNLLEKKI